MLLKDSNICLRNGVKQDVSEGCISAHERCCNAGCALEVMGEIAGLMLGGKVVKSLGLRIGEM